MRADIIGWVALAVLIWSAFVGLLLWATHRWKKHVHNGERGE